MDSQIGSGRKSLHFFNLNITQKHFLCFALRPSEQLSGFERSPTSTTTTSKKKKKEIGIHQRARVRDNCIFCVFFETTKDFIFNYFWRIASSERDRETERDRKNISTAKISRACLVQLTNDNDQFLPTQHSRQKELKKGRKKGAKTEFLQRG